MAEQHEIKTAPGYLPVFICAFIRVHPWTLLFFFMNSNNPTATMPLSNSQLKFLRARCHELKPVVMLGQKGLSEAVLNELDIALDHHELVKIKLAMDDRDSRKQIADEICRRCDAEAVQFIGKILSVYRANTEKPVIVLPKA